MAGIISTSSDLPVEGKRKSIRVPKHWILIFFLSLAVGFFVFQMRQPNMVFQGKSIDYWFDQLPLTMVGKSGGSISYATVPTYSYGPDLTFTTDQKLSELASLAFHGFGTNAIPYLFAKLEQSDSNFEIKLRQSFNDYGISQKYFPFRFAAAQNYKAVSALKSFDGLPPFALSHLQSLTNSPSILIRWNAEGLLHWHENMRGSTP